MTLEGTNGGSVWIGTPTISSWARLEVAGQVKITWWVPGFGKYLMSDTGGLASWSMVTASSVTASGVTWGIEWYLPNFGTGGNGLYASNIHYTGGKIGINTINPTYRFDVQGSGSIIRAGSGFCLGMTASGCLTDWTDLNNIVKSTGTPHYIAKFASNGTVGNSQLYETGGQLWIGDVPGIIWWAATRWYITIEANGSTNSSSPFLTLSENGWQECRMWITGSSKLGSNCLWAAGTSGLGLQPHQIAKADSLWDAFTGSVMYQNGLNIGIGTSIAWAKLEVAGQVKITGGSPWVWKILTSDSSWLASWSSSFSGNTTASGITGGTQNYVTKFGTWGNGIVSSQIYDDGTNIWIWTGINLTTRLTIDSGMDDDSGLMFARLNTASPLTANGVLALWVNASWKVLPISPISNIAVYTGIDRVATLNPNPDFNTFNITYDFNRYFAIPGKQSFVVSNGDSSSYNGPYFKENGTSALCSVNGTYGASPYDCAIADPATGISASPHNSFTMTAKGDTFGYQIALGARWDAPLFARSGRYNGSQSGWLYTNDSPYQTPAPWQKVLSLPANHPEYLYINTGFSSQLQSQTGWWNVGIGTTTPQSRFEVWTGSTTTSLIHFRWMNNVGMGLGSSRPQQTGNANSAFWNESLFSLTSGYSNTAIGYRSLRLTVAGFNNSAIGQEALYNNNGWSWNTAAWYQSLYSVTSGTRNLGFWPQSLYNLSTGNDNIAIWYQAARALAGSAISNNIAIWYQALYSTTASSNIGIGYQALYANTSGTQNTALWYQSLGVLTTGMRNTAFGYNTLTNATGNDNIAIGANTATALTLGSNNIAIGANIALPSTTASNQLNIWNWIYGSAGNIGIGTSTGAAKFNIANNVATNFLDNYNEYQIMLYDGGTAAAAYGIGIKWSTIVLNSGGGAYSFDSGGNTSRMVIDTSGNVGIGTVNPGAKLDVNGTIKISWGTPGVGRILVSDAAWLASWQAPAGASVIPWAIIGNSGTDPNSNFVGTTDNFALSFRTNNVENMRMLTSGNLGIGTTTPASRLSISGAVSVGYPSDAAPTNGAIINGNVGIGTVSPGAKLDVVGSIRAGSGTPNVMMGTHPSYGNSSAAWWKDGADYSLLTDSTNTYLNAPQASGNIYLRTANTDKMFIRWSDGNVGIGTTSPAAMLDINGQIRIAGWSPWIGKILVSDGTGIASWQTAATGSLAGWWILGNAWTTSTTNFIGTTDNVDFVTRTNSTEKMRVQAWGNVGIGIATPWVKLDVAGLIRSTNNGAAYFQGWDDAQLWDVNIANTVGIVWITDATKGALQLWNNTATYIAGSAGNIGIGTVSPGAKLDVNGTIKISWGTPGAGKVLTSDAAGLASWVAQTVTLAWWQTNYVWRWTSATTLGTGSIFDNATNVGIGTTSPWQKLDVIGNIRAGSTTPNAMMGTHPSYGNGFAGWWEDGFDYSLLTDGVQTYLNAPNAWGNLYFRTANADKMFIRWSDGNVGIGTTTPWTKLEVNGQIKITGGSPWAGRYLVSDASGVGTWTTPASSQTWTYIYRMTTPQSTTNTTLAWVTQLTSIPLPIWPYQFEVIGRFQSAAANTGIGLTLAQTSGTNTNFIGFLSAQLTTSTMYESSFMTQGVAVTTTGVPLSNTDYAVLMRGSFDVTATGTVAVRMATENNGTQVILGIWTALIIKSLDPNIAGGGI